MLLKPHRKPIDERVKKTGQKTAGMSTNTSPRAAATPRLLPNWKIVLTRETVTPVAAAYFRPSFLAVRPRNVSSL